MLRMPHKHAVNPEWKASERAHLLREELDGLIAEMQALPHKLCSRLQSAREAHRQIGQRPAQPLCRPSGAQWQRRLRGAQCALQELASHVCTFWKKLQG